jgi:hypothetical protein
MAERLTYSNLQSNPSALYLFKESGEHYIGRETVSDQNQRNKRSKMIDEIRRRPHYRHDYKKDQGDQKHLVYFHIDQALPRGKRCSLNSMNTKRIRTLQEDAAKKGRSFIG